MKIALVTMPVKTGKCEENFQYMKDKIELAVEQNADVIVFPQNCISGYLVGDAWLDEAWCTYVDSFNEQLIALSNQIAIVWGNIKYRGKHLFNCAFFAKDGKSSMRVKTNSDNKQYQDSRYFDENAIHASIELKDYECALNFGKEVTLCDLNFNIDAGVYDMDQCFEAVGNMVYCNAVGMMTQAKHVHVLQGGSYIRYNKKVIYQAPFFKEDFAIIDLFTESQASVVQPDLLDALVYGIRTFDKETLGGRMPWIVGLSGGLDSSVTAALLTAALGNDRVYGYNMATSYNSLTTITNAQSLASALGIHYKEGSIEKLVSSSVEVMEDYGYDSTVWPSLVTENIQARIRGHMLATFAAIHGGVIVNNGNKVEATLGYCTLYGDAIGALCAIGDVNKMQLFDLSKAINKYFDKEVIPASLLPEIVGDKINWEMPPSAELAQGQFDPMKWFYHDLLLERYSKERSFISVMKQFADGTIYNTEIGKWIHYYHLENGKDFLKDLDWLSNTLKRNTFKRVQVPPVLMMHDTSLKVETQCRLDTVYEKELRKKIEEIA